MDCNVEPISLLEMLVGRSLPLRNIMLLIWKRQGKKNSRKDLVSWKLHCTKMDSYRQMCRGPFRTSFQINQM